MKKVIVCFLVVVFITENIFSQETTQTKEEITLNWTSSFKEAIKKSLEEKLSSKTKNRNSLKKSGIVQIDGDLTGPEVLGKMATIDATLEKARSNKPKKVKKYICT